MQAAMTLRKYSPAARFHFAGGRSYMMRSEKRGAGSVRRAPAGGDRRPPRRRRRRAGSLYKFFMILLLLTVWPVGLVMLWRRRLRWSVSTKLMTSIISLAACVLLVGFALTVDTGNARYAAVQDGVNSFLDDAADAMIHAGTTVSEKAVQTYDGASDLADALWSRGSVHLSHGIDWGVAQGQKVKGAVSRLFGSDEPSEGEDARPEASPETSDAPEALPSSVPAAEITVGSEDASLPVYIPASTPEARLGQALTAGVLSRDAEFEEGELPEPTPTPEPTPEPQIFHVKRAEEATVYYFNGSKFYHMASNCGSMTNAPAHSFGEVRGSERRKCSGCSSPDAALLDEEYIVWLDADKIAHLTDECEHFKGRWNLMRAEDAIEAGHSACPYCDADHYLAAVAVGDEIIFATPEPEETPTPEPTEEPTPKPTEAATEKPSARATVKPSATAKADAPSTKPAATRASSRPSAKPSAGAPTLAPAA